MIIGIDPGNTGALALFDDTGELIEVEDMPLIAHGKKLQVNIVPLAITVKNWKTMAELDGKRISSVLEQVHAMPKQGVTSSFNFGMGYGGMQGILATLMIPMQLVTPGKWKKHHRLINKDKDNARTLAQQLFPTASLARKKDIGRADAILIGLYGHQTNR